MYDVLITNVGLTSTKPGRFFFLKVRVQTVTDKIQFSQFRTFLNKFEKIQLNGLP